MKYAFIKSKLAGEFPVSKCCTRLEVSRSGYYKWASLKTSKRDKQRLSLVKNIKQAHAESRSTYGSPRVHRALKAQGIATSKGRVERLMRQEGIRSKLKRRFRITTDSNHSHPISPNLLKRNFKAAQPNQVWVSDVTYLWTRAGWLYLAVTLDLFSRRVVGWSMAERLDADLVVKALEAAVERRAINVGLIHHSDRGKEYGSHAFRAALARHSIMQSMSRKGDCWDNAVAESFFHTLKSELSEVYATKAEARAKVFEWLEVFYNRCRLHSTLGYQTPAAYEESQKCVS